MFRPPTRAELAHLSALAMRSKASWGYSAEFMEACRDELTVGHQEDITLLEIRPDGSTPRIIGFYGLERLHGDRAELIYLFVEPHLLGRGFGRRLLTHAMGRASAQGVRALLIVGDPNATAFYERCGARLIGEQPSESIPGRVLPLFELSLQQGQPASAV